MTVAGAEHIAARLQATYARIERERMRGLPILNNALKVQAVGFRAWREHYLGVLITPWFMNLMLLPRGDDGADTLSCGRKTSQSFPSGRYEFIVGEEDGIGCYQMCSLFSPVFEFADQQTAVAVAEAVMAGLMEEANRDDSSTCEDRIRNIWNGEDQTAVIDPAATAEGDCRPKLEARFDQPMSRRDWLRGAVRAGRD